MEAKHMRTKTIVASIVALLVIHSVAEAQNLRVRGSVGIGTFDPKAPLHIMGAAGPPSGLAGGNNGLLLGSSGESNSYKWIQSYSGPLVLNPLGSNVGIGLSPAFPLDVNGIVRIVGNNNWTPTGANALGLQFGSLSNGYKWIQSFESQPLILNGGGNNVGIGLTNPAFPLDVNGIVRIVGNTNWTPTGANALGLQFGSLSNSYKWIQSFESQPLILNGGGNRVGIGTTTPAGALDIAGGTGPGLWVRASTGTVPTGAPGAGVYLGMGTVTPTGYLYAYDYGSNIKRDLVIQGGSGNVSIGHNSPVTTLDVGGSNGMWVRASGSVGDLPGAGAGVFLGSWTGNNTAYLFAFDYSNNIAQNLAINSPGGNVGIGTTTPTYTLQVNGTAAGTSWTNLSSRDYKQAIRVVPEQKYREMLDRLVALAINTYEYKKEFGGEGSSKLGFVAEEMPKEVLTQDGKGVDIYELLAYTIGALKAQQKEIEELRAQVGRQASPK